MSKIRFLKISSFYPDYLNYFYQQRPELKTASYTEQHRALMDDSFYLAGFWKKNLNNISDFEAEELILDAEHLQKQWAREHDMKFTDDNWKLDILKHQVAEFKPDILFWFDVYSIPIRFRKAIHELNPQLKIIIGWDGLGLDGIKDCSDCNIVLSCSRLIIDKLKKQGVKAWYFPYGFEHTILDKIKKDSSPKYDVSFVGSITLFKGGHYERLKLIAELSRKVNLDFWISTFNASSSMFSRDQLGRLRRGRIREILDIRQIAKHNKGIAFGQQMYQILVDSKITINNHIDAAYDIAANQRLFEATGAGTCLVTDWKKNIEEYFEPDKEIVTYKSVGECVEKVNYLLKNEELRKQIASTGQSKTLNKYSFQNRILDFYNQLIQYL